MHFGQKFGHVRNVLHQIEAEDAFHTAAAEGEGSFRIQNDLGKNGP